MAKIKTLAELKIKKDQLGEKKSLREEGNPEEGVVRIRVSMATCGIAAGGKQVKEYLEEELKGRDIDAEVTQAGCMCYCYAEPTIEVTLPGREAVVFGNVDTAKVDDIIDLYVIGGEIPEGNIPVDYYSVNNDRKSKQGSHAGAKKHGDAGERKQTRIALRNSGVIDPDNIDDYIAVDGYKALGKALAKMDPQGVIDEVKKSGLRGRGGGGFPTGLKWEFTKKNSSPQKYVVCNADEGDPGAFMDRSILESDPHSVLEAMALCGYSIGADTGLIYIRAEYPLAITRLLTAIEQAREYGFLGKSILSSGFNFDIELKYGAGAFVCGEETALIHSMEGKRGEPTVKPPFPAESGYYEKPTNVNNVETLASIPVIINKGAEWFSSIGTESSKGTKVFALAGKINNVGLIEVPMGTTLREVIYDIGGGIASGKEFKAVQTGGPSGGCLTREHLDVPIDYDNLISAGSMMGSGGMIIMDEDDCMVSIAKFYLDFTVEESCGKCTPCRIGNKRLYEILERITQGHGSEEDLARLRNLSSAIKDTALCGLGQTSPNPVLSTMDNFYDEYLAHVVEKNCPAKQCRALLFYEIDPEKCVGCTLCARKCPVDSITGKKKNPHLIHQESCIKCGTCLETCRFDTISVN